MEVDSFLAYLLYKVALFLFLGRMPGIVTSVTTKSPVPRSRDKGMCHGRTKYTLEFGNGINKFDKEKEVIFPDSGL